MEQYDMSKARKEKEEELTAKYFLRYVSYPISKILIYHTSVTPNQITILSFIIGLGGAVFFYFNDPFYLVLGGICALLFAILDNVDGDIARIKGPQSKVGKWLEGTTAFILIPTMSFGLALGMDKVKYMALGSLVMISFIMQFLIVYFFKFNFAMENKDALIENVGNTFIKKLRYAYGTAFFFVTLSITTILGVPEIFLWFFAIIGNMVWIITMIQEYKYIRGLD